MHKHNKSMLDIRSVCVNTSRSPDIRHKLTMIRGEEQQNEGSGLKLVHLSDVLDLLGELL